MTGSSKQLLVAAATEAASPRNAALKPTGAQLLAAFPPRPLAASWPATEASRAEVLARVQAAPFTLDNRLSQQTRRLGVLAVLSWLQTHPGGSWQHRWQASAAEDQPDWRDLITAAAAGQRRARPAPGTQLPHLSPGLLVLICADVIRPGLGWLLRFAPARHGLATEMARTRDSVAFAALAELCAQGRVGLQTGQQALTRIGMIMAGKGGPVADVRVGDCVELLQVAAGIRATSGSEAHAHSPLFYQLLRSHGVLGEDAPAAIEMFSGRGRPSCEQLIGRYQIACRPVRDVPGPVVVRVRVITRCFQAAATSRGSLSESMPGWWASRSAQNSLPSKGGPRQDQTFEEHRGFWTWAMVEVLRHTGIRIEELTELSHHSLIQYRLPGTGELIPLLQIAPSKTDAERLLVISPELADVLSAIVARARAGQPQVPPVVSYDKNERVYNPPMPLLFQWRRRLENRPVTETVLCSYLDHALTALGVKDAAGRPMRYTFHDFRRLFITDAIMHGMPPHIAQLVAGHRDINTTMGYKAVYPDEVINGHRAFIARRRALRPGEEYRTPTDEEWDQFIGHFERRKVSVGDCGRSYDTPCIHEHSCLRCPLLRPDPAARDRLAQIRDNLTARIAEAQEHRWLGEAEGLKVSLAGAGAKLAEMDQISARRSQAVHLGIPAFTHAAGRASTAHPNVPEHR